MAVPAAAWHASAAAPQLPPSHAVSAAHLARHVVGRHAQLRLHPLVVREDVCHKLGGVQRVGGVHRVDVWQRGGGGAVPGRCLAAAHGGLAARVQQLGHAAARRGRGLLLRRRRLLADDGHVGVAGAQAAAARLGCAIATGIGGLRQGLGWMKARTGRQGRPAGQHQPGLPAVTAMPPHIKEPYRTWAGPTAASCAAARRVSTPGRCSRGGRGAECGSPGCGQLREAVHACRWRGLPAPAKPSHNTK